jgi:transposase-like protein/preprotein translocase subunit Sss1
LPASFNKRIYILPKFSKKGYIAFMKTLHNSLTFDLSDEAKYRHHVLSHYYQYGWRSARDAFQIPKTTIYRWKKVYEQSAKSLDSLIPKSTRPHQTRTMTTDFRLELFIKSFRQEYGNISKYKIKPFLDEYAKSLSIKSYGCTKIGRIIKRRHYFFEAKKKKNKAKIKPLSQRIKRAPKEKVPGYIEMDSIVVYVIDKRYYFITAIDIVSKFAWCKLTTNLSSRQAKLALEEFINQYSTKIRAIQTDNGSEFMGEFHQYLKNQHINHELIYPRSPKINAVVERFNRTIKEEFIERSDYLYYDMIRFNHKLVKYLNWYNQKRPHYSLKYLSPVQYMEEHC